MAASRASIWLALCAGVLLSSFFHYFVPSTRTCLSENPSIGTNHQPKESITRFRGYTPKRFQFDTLFKEALKECEHVLEQKVGPFFKEKLDKPHLEGHLFPPQAIAFCAYAKVLKPATICEIGFNAGHSSYLWLSSATSNTVLYSFDICQHQETKDNYEVLRKEFPDRLHLTCGSSVRSVPEFVVSHPNVKCDIINIDGGHETLVPFKDVFNMLSLVHEDTLFIMDDTGCIAHWCHVPQMAWDLAVQLDVIKEGYCTSGYELLARGWCHGWINMTAITTPATIHPRDSIERNVHPSQSIIAHRFKREALKEYARSWVDLALQANWDYDQGAIDGIWEVGPFVKDTFFRLGPCPSNYEWELTEMVLKNLDNEEKMSVFD